MDDLFKLEPELLWKHFAAICSIPHPSGHEQQLRQYITDFSKINNLNYTVDNAGNIVVYKNSTPTKKDVPGVILQSHLDMVPQKNDQIQHNFLEDPIRPVIDGDWVRAQGTTLGADNGIGVAAMLAVLENTSIEHGPLEALFTIDEETGMSGVQQLESGFLKGKRLINLDSEDERELCVGCAGGMDALATFKLSTETSPDNCVPYMLSVKGLLGGHSGVDIHRGRANAIKLLARILYTAGELYGISINNMYGGTVRNAIPREAFSEIMVPLNVNDSFKQWIRTINAVLKDEFGVVEPGISIEINSIEPPEYVIASPEQHRLLRALYACPNGVYRMSNRFEGIVETSNNISIISCDNGTITVECLIRSSIKSSCDDCKNTVHSAFALGGAHMEFNGEYPGWQPNPSSTLLTCTKMIYKEVYKRDADIQVVHAGLECGLIGAKYPDMDMISCGPTIRFPHSPDERVHIKSVSTFWTFLTTLLERC